MTRWNDSIDFISIKTFLHEEKNDSLYDAIVEEKKNRAICEKNTTKLRSKKKFLVIKKLMKGKS